MTANTQNTTNTTNAVTGKTRVKLVPTETSGRRTSWFKLVTRVNKAVKNGYAFEGPFLEVHKEIELPVGAIVIEKEPKGSVRSGSHVGNLYRVLESPQDDPDLKNPSLQFIASYDWHTDFLSFRDAVAKAVEDAAGNKPDAKQLLRNHFAALLAKYGEEEVVEALKDALADHKFSPVGLEALLFRAGRKNDSWDFSPREISELDSISVVE